MAPDGEAIAVADRVLVRWGRVAVAEPLVRALARELTGRDPGPLHHACPTCGSVEHGRPYVEAPVHVSVAHAPGLTLVAVTDVGPVGVDLEAGDDLAWTRREAIGKAHGVGLSRLDEAAAHDAWTLDIPGHAATVVVLRQPGAEAAASDAATRRTAR
jgi:4'-phosphopantetheinyl transferase